MNLAIGFVTEFGFDWSIQVPANILPTNIAKSLQAKTKGDNCCGTGDHGLWPDRILVIQDGLDGPEICAQYHAGLDYPKEGQTHFVDWKENHVTAKGL
ncbi:MAG: hypothetical protein V3V68_05110 [Nitrosomonadaceae bacterium]